MAMYGDTLNQTFPGISSNEGGELHRTFHTSSNNTKPTGLNFEQQFLFGKIVKFCCWTVQLKIHDTAEPSLFDLPYQLVYRLSSICSST